MRFLRLAIAKVRALFRRNAVADEIRDEMQFHVEMRADEYERQGLPPERARRAATRRFGNLAVMQDRGYDVRGGGMLETIWQDVRYAVRSLARQRGFAVVTILTLALAMGASTALFSVIDAALIRPVPYPKPEEIVSIRVGATHAQGLVPSVNDLEHWRASSRVFAHVARGRIGQQRLIVDAGQPERLTVSRVSEDFFDVYGVTPLAGRSIVVDDTRRGAAPVVLLGHDYWQGHFSGDPAVIGRTVRVDGTVSTIVGVVPPGFHRDTAVWRPLPEPTPIMHGMRGDGTDTYGRLRTGLSIQQAVEELTAVTLPDRNGDRAASAVFLEPLYEATVARYRPVVRTLAGAVVMVLLIACINVSGMLLARGATRQGELAVRASMGAGRGRLIRQLLTESLVLAAAGGLGGLVLSWLALDALISILPISLPENAPPAINLQVLAFGATLSLLTSVAFGLIPAIRLSRAQVGLQLAQVGRRHGSPLSRRGGQILITAEVALALVLLSGAGLMIRSFSRALSVDVGFDPRSFVTMEVFPVDTGGAAHARYFPALLEAIRALPGVSAAGAINRLPLAGSGSYTNATGHGESVSVSTKEILPGYFDAIGLTPLQGRFLDDADHSAGAAAVLSQAAARQLFPDGPAVGRTFTMSRTIWNVVGVVADIRSKGAFEPDRPAVYLPFRPEDPGSDFARRGYTPIVVVRPAGDGTILADSLRRAAHAVGPSVIVERIRSGSDWFGDNVEQTRHRTLLLGLIAGLGLVLTLVGIIGVTAYAVARRTREIGVRMAFGARPVDVVARILRDAAWPVGIGVVLGLGGAYYATRAIESFLYEVPPRDPATFAAVALVMGLVALLAAWIPARRAATIDPVVALRAE